MVEGRVQIQNPVLLVGLGGTGKQIMMNFRRMVYDVYNEATYPYVGHVMIDTDARSLTLDGREYDFVTRSIDFDATERVDAELKKSDQAIYEERPEAHPHITNWFDASLHSFGRIAHGAGRIRSFGRLAFFNNYNEFITKIRTKVGAIGDFAQQNQVLKDLNLRIDAQKLDIWVIFSLAGGTGSGMFLDAAFSLKQEFPNASIKGIAVLPTIFSEDYAERVFANAYSALMELEHYNFSRQETSEPGVDIVAEEESWLDDRDPHRFPVAWTLEQYRAGSALPGPVFDNCYIIDNKPRGPGGRVGLADKNAICEMLAEYLFIEYGSGAQALADIWRSGRSNLLNPLQNLVEYSHEGAPFTLTETFCCRYSSVGLSKLHVPSARIASIMRHRLALDLCTSWTRPNVEPSDINERFDQEYAGRLLLGRGQTHRTILRELNGPLGRDEITEEVRAAVMAKRSEFLGRAATENVGDQMREWMRDDLMRRELDNTAPTPSEWGAKSRNILITNPELLNQRLSEQLERIVDENLSQPKRRFTLARAWLRRAHELFAAQAEDYETQTDRRRNRANRAARDLNDRLDWLHDRGDSFTRRQIIKVAFELMEERAVNEAYAQLNQAAAEVCRKMAGFVGIGTVTRDAAGKEKLVETGLLNQLRVLESSLSEEVGGELERRLVSLKRIVENPVYSSLYEEGDNETFYRTGDGKAIDDGVIADLEKRFFQEFATQRYPSFWQMRRTIEKQGTDRLVGDLLHFARLETSHLDTHIVTVIDRLAKRHRPSDPQFEAEAIRLLQNGNPWLGKATHFWSRESEEKNVATFRWIAMHEDPGSEVSKAFRDALLRNSDEDRQFVDSAPDRVYVVSEMAGFPLMSIPDLEKYRDLAYLPLMRKEVIHGDSQVDKFRDLLLKDQKSAKRYKEVLRIVAEALLSGVLEARLGRGGGDRQVQLQLYFQDPENVHSPETRLGPVSGAIWRLANDGAARMLRDVSTQVTRAKNDFGEAKLAQLAYLLSYHGRARTIPHADLCIAMRALAMEMFARDPGLREEARAQGPKIKEWAVARPAKTGLWVIPDSGGWL